jgi:hypothetical protein
MSDHMQISRLPHNPIRYASIRNSTRQRAASKVAKIAGKRSKLIHNKSPKIEKNP